MLSAVSLDIEYICIYDIEYIEYACVAQLTLLPNTFDSSPQFLLTVSIHNNHIDLPAKLSDQKTTTMLQI